jgi:hypothetical protein
MTDVRHVVVRVEISPPFVVVQILHIAANDLHGVAVGDAEIASQQSLTLFECGLLVQ